MSEAEILTEDSFLGHILARDSLSKAARKAGIDDETGWEILRRYGIKVLKSYEPDGDRLQEIADHVASHPDEPLVGVSSLTIKLALAWTGYLDLLNDYAPRVAKASKEFLNSVRRKFAEKKHEMAALKECYSDWSLAELGLCLARLKIDARLQPFLSVGDQRALIRASNSLSSIKLAERYHCSDVQIRKIQDAHGVIRGGTRHHCRRHQIGNQNAFRLSAEFSAILAYWCGFFSTDGCIPDKYHIRIKLAARDRSHLVKFAEYMQSSAPIRTTTTVLSNGKKWRLVYIDICSIELVKILVAECGQAIGDRIANLQNIEIPELLWRSPHFWRGYFDGDGWLMVDDKQRGLPIIGLTSPLASARRAFSKFLAHYLQEHGRNWRSHDSQDRKSAEFDFGTSASREFTNERIEFSGQRACELTKLLYFNENGEPSLPSLDRKAAIAAQHMAWKSRRRRKSVAKPHSKSI